MEKVILRTKGMLDRLDIQDEDCGIWKDIYDIMNGKAAYVKKSEAMEGKYVFCRLADAAKNKDLFYLIEQDSMIGRYIGDWEEFEADWDAGCYEMDGCIYLDAESIALIENSSEKF